VAGHRGRRWGARLVLVGTRLAGTGLLDRVVGGPGLRPRAEMRLPGLAWLELRVEPGADDRRTVVAQRALFHPHGLAGQLYWWAVYPFHGVVFGGMQRGIAQAAATVERARTDR